MVICLLSQFSLIDHLISVQLRPGAHVVASDGATFCAKQGGDGKQNGLLSGGRKSGTGSGCGRHDLFVALFPPILMHEGRDVSESV